MTEIERMVGWRNDYLWSSRGLQNRSHNQITQIIDMYINEINLILGILWLCDSS